MQLTDMLVQGTTVHKVLATKVALEACNGAMRLAVVV